MICSKSDKDSKEKVITTLKNKKIVVIPTDTVYGFSGIYDSEVAEKIREIKGRAENKPFIQLIARPEDLKKYTDDSIPEKLLKYWPGPLTIIVNDKRLQNDEIKTTAFRCPGDLWLRQILAEIEVPLYSTSLNRSGEPVLYEENEILKEFSSEADLIVLDGDKKDALPSTIVRCTGGEIKILRQGSLKIE